jgi:hypothetical protein
VQSGNRRAEVLRDQNSNHACRELESVAIHPLAVRGCEITVDNSLIAGFF